MKTPSGPPALPLPPPAKPSPAVTRSLQRMKSAMPLARPPEISAAAREELRAATETARQRLADGDARGAVLAFCQL